MYGFDMSRIKAMALLEPLVDNVDPEQVPCDPACVGGLSQRQVAKNHTLVFHLHWPAL